MGAVESNTNSWVGDPTGPKEKLKKENVAAVWLPPNVKMFLLPGSEIPFTHDCQTLSIEEAM